MPVEPSDLQSHSITEVKLMYEYDPEITKFEALPRPPNPRILILILEPKSGIDSLWRK